MKGQTQFGTSSAETSTEWRDDEANLFVVRELNRALEQLPFSREYEGVLDDYPFRITWSIGPNLPVAWKGGVAGILGDNIALAGGLWMPGRINRAYAYHIKNRAYSAIPPPPFETAYTQGIADASALYLIGGRSAGRNVARLGRSAAGEWQWAAMPSLPPSDEQGRWLGTANIIPGRWLFLLAGHPTGTPSETGDIAAPPAWRLRLDKANAAWEPMAAYPGGKRNLVGSGTVRGKLYIFGGSQTDATMRSIHGTLAKNYMLSVPYNGVPQYRDAYCYDPDTDRWRPVRNLPFPMVSGTGIVLQDRYILLMGTSEVKSMRVGKSIWSKDPFWRGYGDLILCYDVEQDNYSRVGVMPYGIATCHWVSNDTWVYGFGGEPTHNYNENTENVLQIGLIEKR